MFALLKSSVASIVPLESNHGRLYIVSLRQELELPSFLYGRAAQLGSLQRNWETRITMHINAQGLLYLQTMMIAVGLVFAS